MKKWLLMAVCGLLAWTVQGQSFLGNRIRLGLELTRPLDATAIVNKFTGATPRVPHFRAVQFELGLFNNTVLVQSLSDIQSLTLEIKDVTNGVMSLAAPLLSKTIAFAEFNTLLSSDSWSRDVGSPSSYHVAFRFLDTEIGALDMTNNVTDNEKAFGMVVTGVTSHGRITCGSGLITLVSDGGTGSAGTLAPVPTYTLSDQEIFALLNNKVNAGVNAAGRGFVLRDINGGNKGIRFYVEVPSGESQPVLRTATVTIP